MSRNKHVGGGKGKGDGRRVHRVEKEIREVIGAYLLRGFRGELPGLVSVSRVIVSKDLRTAKVLVTMMVQAAVTSSPSEGSAADEKALRRSYDAAIDELQAHASEIQTEINRRLQMKHCPRLTFIYDDGLEHALRIESILRDLKRAREGDAASTGADESDSHEGKQDS